MTPTLTAETAGLCHIGDVVRVYFPCRACGSYKVRIVRLRPDGFPNAPLGARCFGCGLRRKVGRARRGRSAA